MTEPKDHLMRTSYTFRKLHDEHHQHETRLNELESRATLTLAEDVEEKHLKKRKLYLKDRMTEIVRVYEQTGHLPDEARAEGAAAGGTGATP